jgi:alkylhydroperoxidase family enzyme
VVRFAAEWHAGHGASAATVAELAAALSPEQLVTLAATVALADWTNKFVGTFDIPLP